MRKIVSSALLLILVLTSGCTHRFLRHNVNRQVSTLNELMYVQVLDNIAMYSSQPDVFPHFAIIGDGTTYDGPRKLDSEICSVLGTELLEGRGWERRESITVQRSRRRLH